MIIINFSINLTSQMQMWLPLLRIQRSQSEHVRTQIYVCAYIVYICMYMMCRVDRPNRLSALLQCSLPLRAGKVHRPRAIQTCLLAPLQASFCIYSGSGWARRRRKNGVGRGVAVLANCQVLWWANL